MDTQEQPSGLQICPTRIDGAPVLFAHKVTQGQCQDRQRGHYHKCFTCAFNNAFVAKNGRPEEHVKPAPPKKVQVG
ncbi:MAG: hypothetical protein IPJ77_24165 [Planctomycetes bacterium]|nr:hypothetical protein [Planctomycetota bacterium]